MTPIEKIARAIALCDVASWDRVKLEGVKPEVYAERYWASWKPSAIAALHALLEPSKAMVEAGVVSIDEVEGDCATKDGVRAAFVGMIQTALDEGV